MVVILNQLPVTKHSEYWHSAAFFSFYRWVSVLGIVFPTRRDHLPPHVSLVGNTCIGIFRDELFR